ncbi:hypothetical protein [Aneurinibacillus migulanus]|uniref:hypothetical protein n=1 Tax=Aneurinibacillus migulanus TaxID=47500 RepID=UPI001F301089|nr:hypothetical protein [Aneurinibacillus migulanus]
MIIQYHPEWIATTPCPKQASVRLPHGSVAGRFLPSLGNRSGEEMKVLVYVPLWWSVPL